MKTSYQEVIQTIDDSLNKVYGESAGLTAEVLEEARARFLRKIIATMEPGPLLTLARAAVEESVRETLKDKMQAKSTMPRRGRVVM